MNKKQLEQVLAYIDSEYAGIVSRMTDVEKESRIRHWAKEIGSMDFDAVMAAVRKLSRGQYMPRTAEVLREIETAGKKSVSGKQRCRIFLDTNGNEVLDLRFSDGSEWMSGYLSCFPDWMQIKFRWMANPTQENTAAWDNYIFAHEERDEFAVSGIFPEVDALMTMVGGAA